MIRGDDCIHIPEHTRIIEAALPRDSRRVTYMAVYVSRGQNHGCGAQGESQED